MKFSVDDFFSKCDKIRLLKKSLMENFIFCAVSILHEYKHLHMKIYFVPSRKLKHTVLPYTEKDATNLDSAILLNAKEF